jgi:hypothetical protein
VKLNQNPKKLSKEDKLNLTLQKINNFKPLLFTGAVLVFIDNKRDLF